MEEHYYKLLGLQKGATLEAIKKAYKKYAAKYHPDKHNGDDFFKERFQEVQEAYEYLTQNYQIPEPEIINFDVSKQENLNDIGKNTRNDKNIPVIHSFKTSLEQRYASYKNDYDNTSGGKMFTIPFSWETSNADLVSLSLYEETKKGKYTYRNLLKSIDLPKNGNTNIEIKSDERICAELSVTNLQSEIKNQSSIWINYIPTFGDRLGEGFIWAFTAGVIMALIGEFHDLLGNLLGIGWLIEGIIPPIIQTVIIITLIVAFIIGFFNKIWLYLLRRYEAKVF